MAEQLSPREIGAMLNDNALSLAKVLLPGGTISGGYYHIGSVRGDKGDSLKISLTARPGAWADYSCSRGDPEGTGDMLHMVFLTVGEKDWGKTLRWARGWLGIEDLDPHALDRQRERAKLAQEKTEAERAGQVERSQLKARNLWMHASPLLGTPAMRYLEERGIDFARIGRLPGSMRFRDDVWHADLSRKVPALLTAGIRHGQHVATHCVYLDRKADGSWGKLPDLIRDGKKLKVAKKIFGQDWLGAHFPVHKGHSTKPLHKMDAREAVHSGEGVEDALTYAMASPWARVVYAGTLGNIGELILPQQAGDLIILAQRDADGSKAQMSFENQVKAQQERARADGSGRRVMCLWPQEGFKDLNDEWRGIRMNDQ